MQGILITKGQRKSQICEEATRRSDFEKSQCLKSLRYTKMVKHFMICVQFLVLGALKVGLLGEISPISLDMPTLALPENITWVVRINNLLSNQGIPEPRTEAGGVCPVLKEKGIL